MFLSPFLPWMAIISELAAQCDTINLRMIVAVNIEKMSRKTASKLCFCLFFSLQFRRKKLDYPHCLNTQILLV